MYKVAQRELDLIQLVAEELIHPAQPAESTTAPWYAIRFVFQ